LWKPINYTSPFIFSGAAKMGDEQAQAEAWVNKPRKIIHNQSLIILLIILANYAYFVLPFVVLIVLFTVPMMVMATIIGWIFATIAYIGLRIYVRFQNKKPL
jgi:hypothetical protein